MTQIRPGTSPTRRRSVGIIADGVVKILLGAAYLVGAARLGELLGVAAWLMVVSGVVLLVSGGIEIRYVRRRSVRTSIRLMAAYDGVWVLAALAGVLMAWQGGGAGGEVWIGYQAVAPIVFAALLMAAAPVSPVSDTGAEDPAP